MAVPSRNSDSDANNYENNVNLDSAGLLIEQPNLPDPGSPWPGLQQGGPGKGGGGNLINRYIEKNQDISLHSALLIAHVFQAYQPVRPKNFELCWH